MHFVHRPSCAREAARTRRVAERGARQYLRMDNGPELKDWCEISKAGAAYIDPGSRWQNPFVESFDSRVRDELLDVEEFSCLGEAKVVIIDWCEGYNYRRPHSALGVGTPVAFAAGLVDDERAAGGCVTDAGGGGRAGCVPPCAMMVRAAPIEPRRLRRA
jgi:transposase InsO family protein